MQISENGVISFRQPFSDPFPRDLPISSDAELPAPAFIAGFWGDINVVKNDGVIFFSEMDANNRRFARSKTHVLNLLREGYGGSLEGFNPTHIFQATWETVHQNDPGIFNRVSHIFQHHSIAVYHRSGGCSVSCIKRGGK